MEYTVELTICWVDVGQLNGCIEEAKLYFLREVEHCPSFIQDVKIAVSQWQLDLSDAVAQTFSDDSQNW